MLVPVELGNVAIVERIEDWCSFGGRGPEPRRLICGWLSAGVGLAYTTHMSYVRVRTQHVRDRLKGRLVMVGEETRQRRLES